MASRSKSTRRGAFKTDHDEQRASAATDMSGDSMNAQCLRDDDVVQSSVITQEHFRSQSAPSAALCDNMDVIHHSLSTLFTTVLRFRLERTRRLQNLRQQRYRARKKRTLCALEQQSQRLRAENARLEQAIRAILATEPSTRR